MPWILKSDVLGMASLGEATLGKGTQRISTETSKAQEEKLYKSWKVGINPGERIRRNSLPHRKMTILLVGLFSFLLKLATRF